MAAVNVKSSCGLLHKFSSSRCLTHRLRYPALYVSFRALQSKAAGVCVCNKENICGYAAARYFPLPTTTPRLRWLSSAGGGLSQQEIKKKIDEITDLFMEARELLSDAVEAKGTIYFNEDLEDATTAVKETLALYNQLLEQLTEEQRNDVVRAIGLKMEELKAQESMIQEMKK
ncbi:uncharacterized protein LOC118428813 [Branchiostoma floridae]|uniref:Uncharacterized protein LOC118428813 n=1 Tax=Branchiostoma floridae TaxID=7739 RepID=A0A9J7N9M7_BRAFL|nr:uncharacterized protein LOC118428813 [Branchiostoma floridae]